MREKPTWKEETWLCPSRKKRFTVILHAPQIVEHKRERKRESEGRERERERKESLREGKVQEEKVEKENGECTCNLTVMKGTPRKECNKTEVKWVRLERGGGWVGGLKKKEKREKRSWISSPLPENAPSSSWSVRPHEMRKPSRPALPDSI